MGYSRAVLAKYSTERSFPVSDAGVVSGGLPLAALTRDGCPCEAFPGRAEEMPPIVSRAIPWHTTFRHADAFSRLLSFRNSTAGEGCGMDNPAKEFHGLGL